MKLSKLPKQRSVLHSAIAEALETRFQLAAVVGSVAPFNGQMDVTSSNNITLQFTSAMDASTLTSSVIALRDYTGNVIPTTLTYNATTHAVTLNPTNNLTVSQQYFSIEVIGGPDGVKAADGTTLAKDFTSFFSTGHINVVDEPVLGGIDDATAIRFSKDGRIFVAEKRGIIKVFDNLDDTTPTIVADISSQVYSINDSGLVGMTLHPNFPATPYIYLTYIYDGDPGGPSPKWNSVATQPYDTPSASLNPIFDPVTNEAIGGGAVVSGRLSRLTISGDVAVPGSEWVMIADWRQQWAVHGLEDVVFGPDGYLYVTAGEGGSAEFQDIGQAGNPLGDPVNEGGAIHAQDILTPGDPQTLSGTIIRIDPNTGLAAPGNPFISSTDLNKQRVIAWGLRNPFRVEFRPGTNEMYIGDVGWSTYEEIDVIPDATDNKAENFGWPAYEGPSPSLGWSSLITDKGITALQNLYANPSLVTMPFYSYSHSEKIVAGSSEVVTSGSSPSGLMFYTGTNFPAVFSNSMIFVDYARREIYSMFVGPDGKVDPATRQIIKATPGTGGAGPVDIVQGPDGALYYYMIYSGETTLHRVRAVGYTDLPVAQFSVSRTTGNAPLTVTFTNSSFDPDSTALTYAWDLNGDGLFDDSTAANPTYTYTTSGTYTVRLKVTKASGLSDVSSPLKIKVNILTNQLPVAQILTPAIGSTWKVGDTINFSGTASDAEDGTNVQVLWNIELRHSNDGTQTNFHRHTLGTFSNVLSGSFVSQNHEYPSWLAVTMTVTDSAGQQTVVEREIFPQTVSLTINSNIPSTQIAVGSQTFTTPFTTRIIAGASTSISAISPELLNNTNYIFTGWDNGQSRSFSIAPLSDTSITATYIAAATTELPGTVIGTEGANASTPTLTRDAVFDNNYSTYFNAPITNGAWAGLDLGTARVISQIAYAARTDGLALVVGGRFQASNTIDFSGSVVDLFTITSAPIDGGLNTQIVNSGTAYRYVRYLSPNGSSGNIAEIKFYYARTGNEDVPATPANLSITSLTSSSVSLAWVDASNNETGFRIERRIGTAAWQLAGTVSANISSFIDINAVPETQYEYRVRAINAIGDSVASNSVIATTFSFAPPNPPTGLASEVLPGGGSVALTWNDVSNNEQSFIIQRRYAGWLWENIATLPANTTMYKDDGVYFDVSYEYRMSASNNVGDSAWSDGIFVNTGIATITPPASPLNLITTTITTSSIALQWTDDSSNESGFKIERRIPAGTWQLLATTAANVTTYTNTGLPASTPYEYRVSSTNRAGDSQASNIVATQTADVVQNPTSLDLKAVVQTGGNQVALSWNNINTASSFKLQRRYAGWIWGDIATVATTSYLDTGVFANVSYEYRIQSIVGGVAGEWSTPVFVDTRVTTVVVPSQPSSLTATNDTDRITLRWTHVDATETGYRIERRTGTNAFASIGTTAADIFTFADTTALADIAYNYRIFAFNTAGDSLASNTATATRTTTIGTAPAAPTGLSAIVTNGGKEVDLSWTDNSNNETAFLIQRRYAGYIWADIATTIANATTFADTTAIANVTYEYQIKALGNGVNSAYSTGLTVQTIPTVISTPNPPTALIVASASATRVDLTWTDNATNETNYLIDRRLSNGVWAQIASLGANITTYSDTTVSANTTYEYRAYASNSTGTSAYSNTATATTTVASSGPSAPTGLAATLASSRAVALKWTDTANNETSYVVERRFAGWIWETVTTLAANTTSYTDSALIGNCTYEFRVKAVNSAGSSDYSNSVSIVTT